MERSFFFGDQFVTDADLNNIETTTASQLIKRSQAPTGFSGGIGHLVPAWVAAGMAQAGVFGSPADYLNQNKNFCASQGFLPVILMVSSGTAMDVAGNFIVINGVQTINKGSTNATSNWTSSANVTNYIKLRYQETSGSVKANDAGVSFYTRYNASYFINVDAVAPITGEILLAVFVADSVGAITTLADRRTYVRTITTADSVVLDPTTQKVPTIKTFYDHEQAVGTGTPSVINPHGLSAADIGFQPLPSSIEEHRQSEHVAGIILSLKSPLAFQSYSGSLGPTLGGFNSLQFQAPQYASMSVGGLISSTALPVLSTQTAPGNGMFYACATNAANAVWVTASVFGGLTLNGGESVPHGLLDVYLPLTLIQITGAAHDTIVFNPGGVVSDVRRFYGMSPYDIRPDFSEPVSAAALIDSVNYINSVVDNLARIRNQIGMALSGNPAAWAPGNINPLTAGVLSNGDLYHTHPGITASSSVLTTRLNGVFSTVFQSSLHFSPSPFSTNVYQNTSGRTLFATLTLQQTITGGGTNTTDLVIGPTSSPATIIASGGFNSASAGTLDSQVCGFVPDGYYYQWQNSGTGGSSTTDSSGAAYE